jgi:hypothetical protein
LSAWINRIITDEKYKIYKKDWSGRGRRELGTQFQLPNIKTRNEENIHLKWGDNKR